jgi:hypothetical protein
MLLGMLAVCIQLCRTSQHHPYLAKMSHHHRPKSVTNTRRRCNPNLLLSAPTCSWDGCLHVTGLRSMLHVFFASHAAISHTVCSHFSCAASTSLPHMFSDARQQQLLLQDLSQLLDMEPSEAPLSLGGCASRRLSKLSLRAKAGSASSR